MAGRVYACASPPMCSPSRIGSWSRRKASYQCHPRSASASQCCKRIAAVRAPCVTMHDEDFDIPLDPPRQTENRSCRSSLTGRTLAFTTPQQYAPRLAALLEDRGAELLWCPTIVTEPTAQTRREVEAVLADPAFDAHGVAFTSREGIRAFSSALNGGKLPVPRRHLRGETAGNEAPFIVAALGKDAELLRELALVHANDIDVTVLVPAVSTPQALVEALGDGRGRKLLCPVPFVDGLEEPPVVPQFLDSLRGCGWIPIRVNSYVTRWLGARCAKPLLDFEDLENAEDSARLKFHYSVTMDALIFTSTAEVEGLLKSLTEFGLAGVQDLQSPHRKFLIAAHGPVTALGAERLGVKVDVVGKDFRSFAGVVDALEAKFCDILRTHSGSPIP